VTATTDLQSCVLRDLITAVSSAADAEQALHRIGKVAIDSLGDQMAVERPGALRPGETDHALTAFFLIAPSRRSMLLMAETGWPPEQHRLVIDIAEGRPGWVVANREALVLPNTDEDQVFTQIVTSRRMGSSMYAPLLWNDEPLGLVSIARQARGTFSAADVPALEALAGIAAAAWIAHGGPDLLRDMAFGTPLALDRAWR